MTIFDIASFLGADRYDPHEICLIGDPLMLWMYAVADLTIWAAYMVIGAVLLWCRVHAVHVAPVAFALFSSFIILCGLTHLTEAITLTVGIYRLDILLRIATAVVSAFTAAYTVIGTLGGYHADR